MTDEPQTSVSTPDAPAADEDRLVEQELLVEDVSIDGMCGVY
jgi:mycofactocin precursor